MEAISYKLPDFEGPLDLLLFLVQKNKLNILDIPIHEVLDQYMEAIRRMHTVPATPPSPTTSGGTTTPTAPTPG